MKSKSLALCALALLLVCPNAFAQRRKRMGPSAIEAARLKKYPPPNYLSHYLPDDRYKIAGGVWKYVSTDLDTYYHLPSSPNMLRQPASRVIGFANAADAEEAGYEPDPTDGTASRVEMNKSAPLGALGSTPPGVGSDAEQAYIARITAMLTAEKREEMAWLAKMQAGRGNVAALRTNLSEAITILRKYGRVAKAIKPTAKYAKFHALLLRNNSDGVTALSNSAREMRGGTMSMDTLNLGKMMASQAQLVAEAKRVGINPLLVQ